MLDAKRIQRKNTYYYKTKVLLLIMPINTITASVNKVVYHDR